MEPVDPRGETKDVPPAGAHDRPTDDGGRAPERGPERLPAVVGDRYTIRGILGQGAMGAVFRAHDRTLDRDVAIKVVRGATNDASDRQARLQREAQLLAALRHPGIVRVHDAGELSGSPFVVFELVEGARPLDRAWGELPLERRVALLRDAARALGHAHARGVIHRDVKPENLLLDAQGRVRVADFGLGTAGGVERLTQSGTCLGTPLYMSPEQFSGGRSPVGPPADVWSLGVCLYEALTGTHPFQAEHLVGLMQQVALGAYPPPEGAPAPLRDVVRRALVVDPAARLQDGEAFAAALDAWLDPRPGATAPRVGALGLGLASVTAVLVALALLAALTRSSPPAAPVPAPAAASGPTEPEPATPAWFEALPESTRALVPAGVYPTDVEGEYLHGRTQSTLVLVPGGAYVLGPAHDFVVMQPLLVGGATEEPDTAHVTTLDPLFIGRCEVTTREFAAFVEATGHRTASEDGYQVNLVNQRTGQATVLADRSAAWRLRRGQPVDQRLPVTCVGPEDAEAYCRWAGLRLPTNDEWEAAARGLPVGGAARRFPWGDALPTRASPRANLKDARFLDATGQAALPLPGMEVLDDGSPWAAAPGSFPDGAAPCGALDLVGNVAEWVDSPERPDLAVYRGGSFLTSLDTSYPQRRQEHPRRARASGDHIGFRVALSAALPPAGDVGR